MSRTPPRSAASALPIHELLALEAVSRLGSVQAAADALHVTPSGVSHRIASLERRTGVPLLRREGRGVALTDAARECVAAIRPGMLELSRATQALREEEHGTVRIATAAAVGAAWLLPRLRDYAASHRAARFEIRSVALPDEMSPDRWDLLVHYGRHAPRGCLRRPLFRERLAHVCAPSLRPPRSRALSAAALARLPSLRLSQLDVPARAAARSAPTPQGPAQLVFDDALAMLEAAANGAGVALATQTSAAPYLRSGQLVRANAEVFDGDRYHLDLSEAGRFKPAARQLYDWLVARAGVEAGGD